MKLRRWYNIEDATPDELRQIIVHERKWGMPLAALITLCIIIDAIGIPVMLGMAFFNGASSGGISGGVSTVATFSWSMAVVVTVGVIIALIPFTILCGGTLVLADAYAGMWLRKHNIHWRYLMDKCDYEALKGVE